MTIQTANLVDSERITTRRITDAGYLQAYAYFSKAGIQQYVEGELFDNSSTKLVNVYRPLSVLEDKEFQKSLRLCPITHGHKVVDKSNYRDRIAGNVGENFDIKDNKIGGNIQIVDFENEKQQFELSLGYGAQISDEKGTFDGVNYDYVIDKMKVNHAALVDNGRCGSEVRVLDTNKEVDNMSKDAKKKDVVDEGSKKQASEATTLNQETIKSLLDNKDFMTAIVAAVAKVNDSKSVDKKETKMSDEASEKLQKKMIADEVGTRVSQRVSLLQDAKDVFGFSSVELSDMTDRQIIIKCLDDETLNDANDDKLLGAFSQAKKFKKVINESKDISIGDTAFSTSDGRNLSKVVDYFNADKGRGV